PGLERQRCMEWTAAHPAHEGVQIAYSRLTSPPPVGPFWCEFYAFQGGARDHRERTCRRTARRSADLVPAIVAVGEVAKQSGPLLGSWELRAARRMSRIRRGRKEN